MSVWVHDYYSHAVEELRVAPAAVLRIEPETMNDASMPSMQTLAPLVDQLQAIAREEILEPRTCRIRLYDDHTYRITIEHNRDGSGEAIVYDRVTGEVYWRDIDGARRLYILDPVYDELIVASAFEEDAEEVVATFEPPFDCELSTMDCSEATDADRGDLWWILSSNECDP